ncbi:MAG: hypothetical protein SFW65_01850 [Alphaproteobacteria bacterium]|nr:hypothetical protein [Alphaproteobacteria bacterium]
MNVVEGEVVLEEHIVPFDEVGANARVAVGERRNAISIKFDRPTDLCENGRPFGGLAVLHRMIQEAGAEIAKVGTRCTVSFDPKRGGYATIKIHKQDRHV